MSEYRLTNEALIDLEKIWIYTFENYSVKQADKYYRLIVNEFEFLSINPYSGRPVEFINKGYRFSKVKSHLIFYKITQNKNIEIIRILHERMNVDFWLK